MSNRQQQYFETYQQALRDLQTPSGSLQDELIVALWRSVQQLQKSNAQQAHKIALLESNEVGVSQEVAALLGKY